MIFPPRHDGFGTDVAVGSMSFGRTRPTRTVAERSQDLLEKRSFIWIFTGLAVVAFTALLGWLYVKSRVPDPAVYHESVALLRQLKQIDAQWELEALKSKSGLNAPEQRLNDPLLSLNALHRKFTDHVQKLDPDGTRGLTQANDAFGKAVKEKNATVEQFKVHNAMLRNSLTFLPAAADEVRKRIQNAITSKTGDPIALAAVGADTSRILLDTLRYGVALPDMALALSIQQEVRRLLAGDDAHPAPLREALAVFAVHVNAILREHRVVADLLNALASNPTGGRIEELAGLIEKEQQRLVDDTQAYRLGWVLLSALLGALLIYAAFRMLRGYMSMERKVAKRTQALSSALRQLKDSEAQLIQNE